MKLTEYYWHEALDRSFVVSEMFEQFILYSPAVQQTPHLLQLASKISDDLGALYQAIGQKHL